MYEKFFTGGKEEETDVSFPDPDSYVPGVESLTVDREVSDESGTRFMGREQVDGCAELATPKTATALKLADQLLLKKYSVSWR